MPKKDPCKRGAKSLSSAQTPFSEFPTMRSSLLLSSVLASVVLVAGCEWSSSDGVSWNDSYNTVNFSGTYPIGAIVSQSDETETTTEETSETTKTESASQTFSGGSGKLKNSNVLNATVTVTAKDGKVGTGTADPAGALTFDNSDFSGSVGAGGSVSVSYKWSGIKSTKVDYQYTYTVPPTVPATPKGTVSSITVHQTGQNVTMTLSNGKVFTGKISGFDYNTDSVQSATEVIAKYNVSGAKGTIIGTLTSTVSSRIIDGVLEYKGEDAVSFSGSISGAGRSVSNSTSSD